MVLFNYSTRELTAKIVYYGPGLCGKTTNLQFIHQNLSDNVRGKMLSLATKTDRTLFFDFLPMDLGEIRGMRTRMQLYTVPGQVFYNETRKLVLKGVDGIVFVADSQKEMIAPNAESFKNLEENLKTHGISLAEIPHVIQFNKRDLPKLASLEELNAAINKYNAPFYESVATTGIGVQDTLKAITKLVLLHLTKKYDPKAAKQTRATPAVAQPAAAAATAHAPAGMAMSGNAAPPSNTAIPLSMVPPPAGGASSRPGKPSVGASASSMTSDEVDHLVDELRDAPPVQDRAARSSAPPLVTAEVRVDLSGVPGRGPVHLTNEADDQDLFEDPSLEVAHLIAGQMREIVIPVQVGSAGTAAFRRYKLSLQLRLDPLE